MLAQAGTGECVRQTLQTGSEHSPKPLVVFLDWWRGAENMGYADKYHARGEPIHLVGVEFSKNDRNIVGFEVEAG